MTAETCRDAAHMERNGCPTAADSLLCSFGLSRVQVAAIVAGRWSAYHYRAEPDLWQCGLRKVCRQTFDSLRGLGLVEQIPRAIMDYRLSPDGEAVARVLARRVKVKR